MPEQQASAATGQAAEGPPPATYYCSFCLRADFEVEKLCAGHGRIYICDACVEACRAYMTGGSPSRSPARPIESQPTERLLALLKPVEETVEGKSNQLQSVVEVLRARGVSWAKIGDALGISRQSAWQRFT